MRTAAFAMLIACIASIASARECVLGGSASMSGGFVADKAFYQCILAEIRDLKRKQAELERTVRQYERLVAEMPAHYTNENGEVEFEEGRKIGSASFILSSRQLGGANSMELDGEVLASVCASPKGCSATLTYRRFGFRSDDTLEIRKVGPCEFEIEESSGCWICGAGCGSEVSITGIDGDGTWLHPLGREHQTNGWRRR